mgnify:FL=1|tara:strand:+ start:232 stop:402 length:171 start_codon:yes stop_codon:yes gene_type:complete
MKHYKWKTVTGEEGIIEADNLLDLIKHVNLILMNKHSYHLDEFISIEELNEVSDVS